MQNLYDLFYKAIPYHRIPEQVFEHDTDQNQSSDCASSMAKTEGYGEEYHLASQLHRPRLSSKLLHTCCYMVVGVLCLMVGFVLGKTSRLEYEIDGYPASYGHTQQTVNNVVWHANATFAAEPNADSERAWMGLMPIGRGFVTHPKLAKEEKSVSAFHELHCLHNVRTAYFTYAYLLSKSHHHFSTHSRTDAPIIPDDIIDAFVRNPFLDKQLAASEYADGFNSEHIKHCFDYLRQALMCAADSNLEDLVVSEGMRSTTGMGSRRTCRDFEALKRWSEKWRSGEGDGIL